MSYQMYKNVLKYAVIKKYDVDEKKEKEYNEHFKLNPYMVIECGGENNIIIVPIDDVVVSKSADFRKMIGGIKGDELNLTIISPHGIKPSVKKTIDK